MSKKLSIISATPENTIRATRSAMLAPRAKAREMKAAPLPAGWRLDKGVEVLPGNEDGWNTWTF